MAIRLMREKDVPTTTRDLVFRASRVYAVLFVLACLGACGAMIALHWPRPNLAYYLSGVIVVLLPPHDARFRRRKDSSDPPPGRVRTCHRPRCAGQRVGDGM